MNLHKFLFFLLVILFFYQCSSETKKSETVETPLSPKQEIDSGINPVLAEQISCSPKDCLELTYAKYEDLDDKISDSMGDNIGKIFIQMKSYSHKLTDEKLESVVDYLREISKREGRVSIEPYYVGHRDSTTPGFSTFSDTAFLGYDIYKRVRNTIKFRNTKNYHAKVLYHPKYNTVMMIFFVHKNYGDVCSTIYSNCKEIEYLDDETFDLSLSTALKEANINGENVQIKFKQANAILPEAVLDIDSLKKQNSSTRLYKWFVAAKKTEKKTIKKDRFLGVEAVISVVSYSIKLYDYIQAYKLYEPAFQKNIEIVYSGKEAGGKIESVVFYPAAKKSE